MIFTIYILTLILSFSVIGYLLYKLRSEIKYRKQIEKDLLKQEVLCHNITEDVVDVIWKTDKDFLFTYISPSVEQALGFTPDELIGHHVFEIFTDNGIASITKVMNQRKEDAKRGILGRYMTVEVEHKRKDGSTIYGEIVSKQALDENQNVISYHGISRDVTQRKELQDKIHELAFYDPLTKLANRRLLHDRLSQTISHSKRSNEYSAILYLDLDNFKQINDTYGHSIGDLLLVDAAKRLKSCVREIDTVARVGGDEFVVIINELEKDKEKTTNEVNEIAQKILSSLSATYSFDIKNDKTSRIEYRCTVSIGVLVFKADDDSKENLFRYADAAMYKAKETGKNTICFHNSNS